MEIFYILLWGLVFGIFCSFIAKEKNRDQTSWFVIGFLFSLLALLALIAVPKVEEEEDDEEYEFTCTDCGVIVGADDKFCPNCGATLEDEVDEENEDEVIKYCGKCGGKIRIQDKFCSSCGYELIN